MPEPSLNPVDAAAAARDFAAHHLGPASSHLLQNPANQALVVSKMRASSTADAVLAVLHSKLNGNDPAADEFLSFFLSDLQRLGHGALGPGLRRFLDSGDLVQSVLGDLWPELATLKFESRDSFLALLAARLRWKAADGARQLRAGKRREDMRQEVDASFMADAQPGPATELVAAEEWQQTALALARLPQRDRELVRAHLRGLSWTEVAEAHSMKAESARKAVQRALAKLRDQAGPAEGRDSGSGGSP